MDIYTNTDLLFTKELAFCIPEAMHGQIATMPGVQHTFLIRDPALVLSSYIKADSDVTSHEFDLKEAGYKQLYPELYKCVKESHDTVPVVVDASDLQANPNEIMKLYCNRHT